MAIVALSMANACAAIANTVRTLLTRAYPNLCAHELSWSQYFLTDLGRQTNTIIHFQVISLGDAKDASWIANANFLMTLAFGPVFGSLGDRFGKRWFIFVATIFGVAGSCISGSAQKTTVVIGGNILTGLANAGCVCGLSPAPSVYKVAELTMICICRSWAHPLPKKSPRTDCAPGRWAVGSSWPAWL